MKLIAHLNLQLGVLWPAGAIVQLKNKGLYPGKSDFLTVDLHPQLTFKKMLLEAPT